MREISKQRYIILGIVWTIILSLYIFVIYIISKNFYNLVDNDGECIVSGYDIQVKTIKLNQVTLYKCVPIVLVNFTYNDKPFSYVGTYSFEYPYENDDILYHSFDDFTKNDCMDKLRKKEQYDIGKNIGNCYRSYFSDKDELICRKQRLVNEKINNRYCGKHFNKGDFGDGYFEPIVLCVVSTILCSAIIFLTYMIIIKDAKPKIITKIFKKKQQIVLPVTIKDNKNGSFEVLYRTTATNIENIDEETLLESGEKKMK